MSEFDIHPCGPYSVTVRVNPKRKTASYEMSIIDPRSFNDGGIEWRLRYTNVDEDKSAKLVAASILSSYDYLVSDAITTREAINRLRILRNARKTLKATK